jgi:hypothetical protein
MNIQFFSTRQTVLPPGWIKEWSISIFGSTRIDASAPPGEDAKLSVITFFGSAGVSVPPGCSIRLSGADFFGSQSVEVEPAPGGPLIQLRAIPILGSIKVRAG